MTFIFIDCMGIADGYLYWLHAWRSQDLMDGLAWERALHQQRLHGRVAWWVHRRVGSSVGGVAAVGGKATPDDLQLGKIEVTARQ